MTVFASLADGPGQSILVFMSPDVLRADFSGVRQHLRDTVVTGLLNDFSLPEPIQAGIPHMSPNRVLRVGDQQDHRRPHSRELIVLGGFVRDRRLRAAKAIADQIGGGGRRLPITMQYSFDSHAGSGFASRMTAQPIGDHPATAIVAGFSPVTVLIGLAPASLGQAGRYTPHRQSARNSNRCAGSLR